MQGWFDRAEFASSAIPGGNVRIAARNEVAGLSRWRSAFAGERKDRRYYELVEDTLKDGFDYGYLIVDDGKELERGGKAEVAACLHGASAKASLIEAFCAPLNSINTRSPGASR